MKRATTEDVRTAILTAKKEVLRIKAMTTVVLNALGESDERDRIEPCLSRVQESWTELSKAYKKSLDLLKQLSLESDDRMLLQDRTSTQITHELRRTFKSTQNYLREQLKVALPRFFVETLYCELQQPGDVVKRVGEEENARRRLKTLESVEGRVEERGYAVVTMKWTIGFTATLVFTGVSYPVFQVQQTRPSGNLSSFLRLLQAYVETRTLMSQNLVMDICTWTDKNLLGLFAAICKGCGRVLSFTTGQPLLAMVSDHKGDFYHEDCIRETLDSN